MMMPLSELILKHGLKINGVIHVGAHHGQELQSYIDNGIKNMIFIEPCKTAFDELYKNVMKTLPGSEWSRVEYEDGKGIRLSRVVGNEKWVVILIQRALGDYIGDALMYVETANTGQSNSLLKPEKHLQYYSNITFDGHERVDICPLDHLAIASDKYNFINMDVQGYELNVLKGAVATLKHIDYIYTEINTEELYTDCAKVDQLDIFLNEFARVDTKMTDAGWGDALYKRQSVEELSVDPCSPDEDFKITRKDGVVYIAVPKWNFTFDHKTGVIKFFKPE